MGFLAAITEKNLNRRADFRSWASPVLKERSVSFAQHSHLLAVKQIWQCSNLLFLGGKYELLVSLNSDPLSLFTLSLQ